MIFFWIKPKSEAIGMALGQIEGAIIFGLIMGLVSLFRWRVHPWTQVWTHEAGNRAKTQRHPNRWN